MRINTYLAHQKYCTRREADALIERGRVRINGRRAVLGDKVEEGDVVEAGLRRRHWRYYAYHKPRGIITHSPQEGEEEISEISGLPGIFPVGRLDKDSSGLIILTNDGRVTQALLSPEGENEKEYTVRTKDPLPRDFSYRMERGVDIGGYVTKPCRIRILGERHFSITLTEGKKHQIRRMCGAFGQSALELRRTRILNVRLGSLVAGQYRELTGKERDIFLASLGLLKGKIVT